ncbi:MAG: methylenetetrahydrofolate reductase [Roseibium sp.]|uniref:methylenetetrahydrofolate reductase n=1 Tax=Roseibium sp. TaxID=1936156 RepID=UPI0026148C5D|nr:methylenetetrahydrofolate reductase [Roseibium sp.]MCV0427358.1 methylenetetrahydrofolate reductase [Roseibium sp.]
MALLRLNKREAAGSEPSHPAVETFLKGFSIEVLPRTAAKIADFRDILPSGTRVYIAHIEGTPIEQMVKTARRIASEGFEVMPHFPARLIKDTATLENWIAMYQGEAGVDQALLLAGGIRKPAGELHSSIQLMESGLFDRAGFSRLHVAGHPEGNRDIDPDGSRRNVDAALQWKQKFSERTNAEIALVTQFAFDCETIIDWVESLRDAGITLPVHIGIAGPARLQTLLKFAIACGVGPSLKVLQKRASDVSKLLVPYDPSEVISGLASRKAANPEFGITNVHFYPLGGIKAASGWAVENGGNFAKPATFEDRT